MRKKLTLKYIIKNHQLGINGRLSTKYLCDFLIDSAVEHSEILGVSVKKLIDDGKTWMLSRFHVQIEEYPKINEEIIIETWPSGINKLFSCRDFLVKNTKGELFAKATTGWLVVDINKKRPVRLPDYITKIQNKNRVISNTFKKIDYPNDFIYEKEFEVRTEDIDINNHVTSVSYITWCLEALPIDFHKNYTLKEIELDYKYEVFYHDKISSVANIYKNNDITNTIHLVKNDDKTNCICSCRWI